MKNMTEYDRVCVYLDKISDAINKELFGGELLKPVITLQKTTGAYGHFETVPMWKSSDGVERYEINLGSETITRPIENVIATMIHEYTHYYNHIKGIQDCSRGGYYHNKKFRDEAQKHMIHIEHDNSIGWSLTSPTEELLDWIVVHNFTDIELGRGLDFSSLFGGLGKLIGGGTSATPPAPAPKTATSIKYHCPKCNMIVRATRNLDFKLVCWECTDEAEDPITPVYLIR